MRACQTSRKNTGFSGFFMPDCETHGSVFFFGLVPKIIKEAMTSGSQRKAQNQIERIRSHLGGRCCGQDRGDGEAYGRQSCSREQFEMRTHKRLIDVLRPSAKTVEALQGLELPAGVEIEINL